MKFRKIWFLFCISNALIIRAQQKKDTVIYRVDCYCNHRAFYSLKEARAANPDSVLCLNLGNNGLREFPIEVLNYKKLQCLDFHNRTLLEQSEFTPWLLTDADNLLIEEIYKKHPKDGPREITFRFPIKNKTQFKKIPDEIQQLKELRYFEMDKMAFSGSLERKLRRLLPKCEIEVD